MLFVGERRRSRRAQRRDPRGASEASGAIELVSCNPKRLGRVLSQESLRRMRSGASVFLSLGELERRRSHAGNCGDGSPMGRRRQG